LSEGENGTTFLQGLNLDKLEEGGDGIAKKEKLRKIEEIESDIKNTTDEKERLKLFQELVKVMNKEEKRNNRKHTRSEKRDKYSITDMDSPYDPDNMDRKISQILLNLCKPKDWDDIIHSKKPEDLPDLVKDRALGYILKQLPQGQLETLYYRVIKGHTAKEIAKFKGVSSRSVRKLYEKALNFIRERYLPVIELKYKFETDDKYNEIIQEQEIYTTKAERKYLDLTDKTSEVEKTA